MGVCLCMYVCVRARIHFHNRRLEALGQPGNRIRFVRACERSCVCLRDDVVFVAGLRKLAALSGVPSCPVPFRALPFAVKSVVLNHVNSS